MNALELLLFQLGEECGELTQASSKIARFGITSVRPKDGKTNLELLVSEYNDVLGTMQLLAAEIESITGEKIVGLGDPVAVKERMDKIVAMAGISVKLGRVTIEDDPALNESVRAAE